MCDGRKKSTVIQLFWGAIFLLLPAMSWAALAAQTEVVSGKIVQQYPDHSVRLDNGKAYYPSREGIITNVQIGDPVTLRYSIEPDGKNIFFEFAPGLGSLQKIAPPAQRK